MSKWNSFVFLLQKESVKPWVFVALLLSLIVQVIYSYPIFLYIYDLLHFPYDWGPGDGDHINFAKRWFENKTLYPDWEKGKVLSIYPPIYHILISWFHQIFPKSSWILLGRAISLSAFLGQFIILFAMMKPKKVNLYKFSILIVCILNSIFIYQPELFLSYLFHVVPHTLYMLFAFISLYIFKRYLDDTKTKLYLVFAAFFSCLALYTKQQALFAPITIGLAILFLQKNLSQSNKWKEFLLFYSTLGFFCLIFLVFMEWQSAGNFFQTIFLQLRKVIPSSSNLARERLLEFYWLHSLWMMPALTYSVWSLKNRKLHLWTLSILVMTLWSYRLLGNGGGGTDYYYFLWCMGCVVTGKLFIDFFDKKPGYAFALPIIVLGQVLISSPETSKVLKVKRNQMQVALPLMKNYYQFANKLIKDSENKKVLTQRISGAFVNAGAEINTEFCTMNDFVWNKGTRFKEKAFLDSIRNREYSFITTGVQSTQTEINNAIKANYKELKSFSVVWYEGSIAKISVLEPKKIKNENQNNKSF